MTQQTRIAAKLYSALPYLAVLWIFLVSAAQIFAEPIASLQPHNYVNDFAGVLDASTQARLNALCQEVEEKAHAQIAVVTVKSTDGEDVFSYAGDLYQKWGIGKKGSDRGVLILRRRRITSIGLRSATGSKPSFRMGKVGGFRREMVPILRAGNYAPAVTLITIAALPIRDCAGRGSDSR